MQITYKQLLLLHLVFSIPLEANAQEAEKIEIHIPTALVGIWHHMTDYRAFNCADDKANVNGIEIHENGRIAALDGSNQCIVSKIIYYDPRLAGENGLGFWTYEGTCETNVRHIPPSDDKDSLDVSAVVHLLKDNSDINLEISTILLGHYNLKSDFIKETRHFNAYRKCP